MGLHETVCSTHKQASVYFQRWHGCQPKINENIANISFQCLLDCKDSKNLQPKQQALRDSACVSCLGLEETNMACSQISESSVYDPRFCVCLSPNKD